MKVLLCTSELQYSNSSAAIRNRLLLKGLSSFADVDVMEFRQTDVSDTNCSDLINRHIVVDDFLKPNINSVAQQTEVKSVKQKIKQLLKPYIPDIFYFKSVDLSMVDFDHYDVVVSSSEPKGLHKLIVKNIKQYQNRKFQYIQYWGDPWFDDISRPTNKLTFLLERSLLSAADHIIYNSSRTLQRQQVLFKSNAQKMHFLPRGIDFFQLGKLDKIQMLHSTPTLLYAGDYRSQYRKIQPLANVCNKLKHPLVIAGNGDIELDGLGDSVEVKGRLTTAQLLVIKQTTEVDVVVMNSSGGQLPGKVYDVMLSSRPVLIILDGEFTADDIPCQSRFVFCDNNEQSIRVALENLPSEVADTDLADEALRSLDIKTLVSEFFKKIEKV